MTRVSSFFSTVQYRKRTPLSTFLFAICLFTLTLTGCGGLSTGPGASSSGSAGSQTSPTSISGVSPRPRANQQKDTPAVRSQKLEDILSPGLPSDWNTVRPNQPIGVPGKTPLRSIDPKYLPNRQMPTITPPRVDEAQAAPTVPMDLYLNGSPTDPPGLGPNIDVQITPDIIALAQSLGNDPLAIFNYVRNNYEFEPYYHGSVKGSQETLFQQAGNDYDLASVLIALLRASDIQSYYVSGTVRIPISDATSWVGVQDPLTAAYILATAGYSVTILVKNGSIDALDVDHVWVEAYVQPHSHLKKIVLDPSFKLHTIVAGQNPNAAAGIDPSQLLNTIFTNSVADPSIPVISQISLDACDAVLDAQNSQSLNYLSSQPSLTYGQVVGIKTIVVDDFKRLPRPPRYTRHVSTQTFDEIPMASRQYIRFQTIGLDTTISIPELASKRLTLSFDGGTAIGTTVGSVNLIPQLMLDGSRVAQGAAAPVGYYYPFILDFQQGTQFIDRVVHTVTIGGTYAVALDTQKVSLDKLIRAYQQLQSAAGNPLSEAALGSMLHTIGMLYFGYQDHVIEFAGGTNQAVIFHSVNEALLSQELQAGTDGTIAAGPLSIDAPRAIYGLFSLSGSPSFNSKANLLAVGYTSSMLEHLVLQNRVQVPALSTIYLFEEAAQEETPLYQIDASNVGVVLPQLQVPYLIQKTIAQEVASGLHVLIPKSASQISDWLGVGWIVFDPSTGAAGFLISGGIASGASGGSEWGVLAISDPLLASLGQTSSVYTLSTDYIRSNETSLLDAFFNGLIVGDYDKQHYNSTAASLLRAGGQLTSGLLVFGAFRDAAANGYKTYETGGQDGKFGLVANAIGCVPFLGAFGKGALVSREATQIANATAQAEGVIADASSLVRLQPFTNNYAEFSTNVTKLQTQTISEVGTTSLLTNTAATEVGTLNFSRFQGQVANTVDGKLYLVGPSPAEGQAFVQSCYAGEITQVNAGAMGESIMNSVNINQNGWTSLFTGPKLSNASGVDGLFLTQDGTLVVSEAKFVSGNAAAGLSTLSSSAGTELTTEWIEQALGSSLKQKLISQADFDAAIAALKSGNLQKQLFVVTGSQQGRTLSAGLTNGLLPASSDILGGRGLKATVIQLPAGTVGK